MNGASARFYFSMVFVKKKNNQVPVYLMYHYGDFGLELIEYYSIDGDNVTNMNFVVEHNPQGMIETLYQYNNYGSYVGQYHMRYTSFGEGLMMTDGNLQPIVQPDEGEDDTQYTLLTDLFSVRYKDYCYDSEFGLYYLQQRYYDPFTCRFISPDTILAESQGTSSYNIFAYCGNNPVNYYDPYGRACICLGGLGEGNESEIRDVTFEVNTALYKATEEIRKKQEKIKHLPLPIVAKRAFVYTNFINMVNDGQPWDIKGPESWKETIGTQFPGFGNTIQYNGMQMTVEDLGNYTYGYLGYNYNISLPILLLGFYYVAGFPSSGDDLNNEIGDWSNIMVGYIMATVY